MADNIKLIVAVIMMVIAITLFYTYSEYSTLLRVLGLLLVAGLAVFLASRTAITTLSHVNVRITWESVVMAVIAVIPLAPGGAH